MASEKENNVLSEMYGAKAFVKVKQCLDIDKMLFSFVSLENSKQYIDCYIKADYFGALLMRDIANGSLYRKLMEEKAKGNKYPKEVWTSPYGGNATANDGKPVSRYFTISPGTKFDVVMTAFSFPATQNDKGAFVPVKGASPLSKLMVGMSYDDLRIMQYRWSFLEKEYMTSKYSLQNMKSTYSGHKAHDTSETQNEGDNCPANTQATNAQIENAKVKTDSNEKKEETKPPKTSNVAEKNYPVYELENTTLLQPFGDKGHLCFKAIDQKNKTYNMVIESTVIPTMDQVLWKHFSQRASKETGVRGKFAVDTTTLNDRCLVKDICS